MLTPGNIFSGSPLARFTNPNELGKRKGNCESYPVVYGGREWPDVESAYQAIKRQSAQLSIGGRMRLLADVMEAKFRQHPQLIDEIKAAGGQAWIAQCSHVSHARSTEMKRWEGQGFESLFLRCLSEVYRRITGEARS